MISSTYECVFVHIPKTGGSSIESLIWPDRRQWDIYEKRAHLYHGFVNQVGNQYQTGGLQHLYATNIKKVLKKSIYDRYWKFTMVRNPWDKAVSQYFYMKNKRRLLRDYIGMKKDTEFKQYLELIQKKDHVQWDPQCRFILDSAGHCLVNIIYRFEEYDEAFRHMVDSLNNGFLKRMEEKKGEDLTGKIFTVKADGIPHINKSDRGHYSQYYDDESRQMVAYIYKEDIKTLEYEFESQRNET